MHNKARCLTVDKSGCRWSTIRRRRSRLVGLNPSANPSAEGTLHLQLANLLVNLVDLDVLGLLFRLLIRPKNIRKTFYQDYSPIVYLTSVYFEPAGQSGDSLFPKKAAKTTFSLRAGPCFLRFCFMFCPFIFAILGVGVHQLQFN